MTREYRNLTRAKCYTSDYANARLKFSLKDIYGGSRPLAASCHIVVNLCKSCFVPTVDVVHKDGHVMTGYYM